MLFQGNWLQFLISFSVFVQLLYSPLPTHRQHPIVLEWKRGQCFGKEVCFLTLCVDEFNVDMTSLCPVSEPVQSQGVKFRSRSVSTWFEVREDERSLVVLMYGRLDGHFSIVLIT